jgi:hypothetical protein
LRGVGKLAPATQSEKPIVSILAIDIVNRSAFLRIARLALSRSRCALCKGRANAGFDMVAARTDRNA